MVRLTATQITSALAQYKELADQSYEIFGVDCSLIFTELLDVSPIDPDNNIPDLNVINSRRRRPYPDDYDNQDQTIETTEVSEPIRLKIYWNAKEWQTIYGYTSVPENHVMMLAKLDQADDLNQAKEIRFIDAESGVYRFSRVSRAVPFGFEKDKYCSSIWEQIQ